MSRVLIIDRCWDCPSCHAVGDWPGKCESMEKSIGKPKERIPDWCPLRPLPEKRNTTSLIETKHEAEENHVTVQHQVGFNLGWNACIDAITGEVEV